MADERATPLNQGVDKWLQVTSQGELQTWDGNTTNFYEQGTWTPTIIGSSSDGDVSLSVSGGEYAKVGNLCHVYALILVSDIITTPDGNIQIGGFPFTIAGSLSTQWFTVSRIENINNTANFNQISLQSRTGTIMELRGVNYEASQSTISASNLTNDTSIIVNFVYRIE